MNVDLSRHGMLGSENWARQWRQNGTRDELPRVDHSRHYQNIASDEKKRLWRITCFVVDKNYRKSGVAGTALAAALESIRKKGGGLVEAIPVSKTDQAQASCI